MLVKQTKIKQAIQPPSPSLNPRYFRVKLKNLQGARKKTSLWQINWQQLWAREMVNRSYGQVISMTIYNGYIQDFFSVIFFFWNEKLQVQKPKSALLSQILSYIL